MRLQLSIAGTLLAAVVISGCVGTGSKQFETVVTDMHERVTTLDRDLEGSIAALNEKTAALIARVDDNERQVRLLNSLMEENQHKIDKLLRMLDELKRTLYRHWGLDPGPAAATTTPSRGGAVTIEPPSRPISSGGGGARSSRDTRDEPSEGALAPPIAANPGDDTAYADAKKLYDAEEFGAARAAFTTFLQDYPNSEHRHKAQFWIGKCHLNESEYTKAIEAFELVRRNYPESAYMAFALHNQAVAHFRRGERETAVAMMEEVVANYPTTTAADHARRDLDQLQGR